jgi:DNA-binding IclR family transcriptional regulator
MLTVDVEVGLVLPLLTSSTGRCFMAFLDPADWRSLAKTEAKQHRPAIKQQEQNRFIAQAKADGLVTVQGSFHPRVAALSAPVWGRDSKLIHVMTVLGWVGELDTCSDGSAARALLEESGSLSALMGYRP